MDPVESLVGPQRRARLLPIQDNYMGSAVFTLLHPTICRIPNTSIEFSVGQSLQKPCWNPWLKHQFDNRHSYFQQVLDELQKSRLAWKLRSKTNFWVGILNACCWACTHVAGVMTCSKILPQAQVTLIALYITANIILPFVAADNMWPHLWLLQGMIRDGYVKRFPHYTGSFLYDPDVVSRIQKVWL